MTVNQILYFLSHRPSKWTLIYRYASVFVWLSIVLLATRAGYAQDATATPRWPELSEEQQVKSIEQLKEFASAAQGKINHPLVLLETNFFLFYSDLKPSEARYWAGLLDKMYRRLAEMFGMDKNANIWLGKAVIFVFAERVDFINFEVSTFNSPVSDTIAGLCHSYHDGRVVIAFYRQPYEMDFAALLVHESVHGFLHRYRSPENVTTWANEGLAEYISYELVPKGQGVPKARSEAVQHMKKYSDLGGNFFTADRLKFWQYGAAYDLTQFMIKQSKKRYVSFINGIKDGLPWEESLEQNYGVSLSRLVEAYGRSNGVRSLRP